MYCWVTVDYVYTACKVLLNLASVDVTDFGNFQVSGIVGAYFAIPYA